MTVWVVLRNGKVDEVFDSYLSARHHQQQLTKLWAITLIVEREVKAL
jgi:hypothetical protein